MSNEYKLSYTANEINQKLGMVDELSTNLNFQCRKYVEEFKTDSNTWNDAFEELFAWCLQKNSETTNIGIRIYNYTACTGGAYYALTRPLIIGDLDVDFENAELFNNMPESEENAACVILTGAEHRVQKFGYVTGRQSVGVLINTATGRYGWNKFYCKRLWGYNHALLINTTNTVCYFSEFHIPNMASAYIPLKVWCKTQLTQWANELYFYLSHFASYRDIKPTKLIEMTNATRCNVYNVDLECIVDSTKEGACEVELIHCQDIAFYNPRTKEPYNSTQFKFTGETWDCYIDSEYCKVETIDSQEMVLADYQYNVWRGRVVTGNAGSVTNLRTLRIYKDMIVPEIATHMVKKVDTNITIDQKLMYKPHEYAHGYGFAGLPTLYKWSGGDITIDKRFIALLPFTIQIVKTSDNVGNILDTDGNIIVTGTELPLNKKLDVCVDSATYRVYQGTEELVRDFMHLYNISLSIGEFAEPEAKEWVPQETITHEFIDGFVRANGTINTTATTYCYTGLVNYNGGTVDFRSVSHPAAQECSVVSFFDESKTFLGNIETAVGGQATFFSLYDTKEYKLFKGYALDTVSYDIVAGTITQEQILEWYPNTKYIAISSPSSTYIGAITDVFSNIENACFAQQTYSNN